MVDRWQRCRDTYDGGDAVKGATEKYLPRLDSHDTTEGTGSYKQYLARALFYNAMGRTVDGLAGYVFQKAPNVEAPSIKEHTKDITLTGVTLELFSLHAVQEVLKTGRQGILVDMAGEEAPQQRPYWVSYRAEDIISWKTERRDGDQILTRVVLKETTEDPKEKDPWEMEEIEQCRVLELTGEGYTQTIYRKKENTDKWEAEEPMTPLRKGDTLEFIPFVFLGPTSITPDVAKPPLIDLADINLSHYRGNADLKHGLHFTALPTPWISGAQGSDSGRLFLGSGTVWELSENGKAGMLEFTGEGLKAIREDLEHMERMMAAVGARLLEEQARTQETATAVGMRHAGEQATLRTIAQTSEQGLTVALQYHAWWVGTQAKPEDTGASVELNKDYFATRLSAQDLQALVMSLQAEGISYETFYYNLTRGELARPGVTAEEELAAIGRGGGGQGLNIGDED
jgi:hypothetical protein